MNNIPKPPSLPPRDGIPLTEKPVMPEDTTTQLPAAQKPVLPVVPTLPVNVNTTASNLNPASGSIKSTPTAPSPRSTAPLQSYKLASASPAPLMPQPEKPSPVAASATPTIPTKTTMPTINAPAQPQAPQNTPSEPTEAPVATQTLQPSPTPTPEIASATVEPKPEILSQSGIMFEVDEEVEYKPSQTFNPQKTSISTPNDKASVVASYGSDGEDAEEYAYDYQYQNAGQKVMMGRGSILPKIFKPLIWIGLISGLATAGWFLSPYFTTWFNMVFPEETVEETTLLQPIDIDTATQTPQIDEQLFNIGPLNGETITVPYTLSGSQTIVEIQVQLEGIVRAQDFGALLEVAKVDLRGTAPEGLTDEQITELINQYRFSYVRINVTYAGEPITPAAGQKALQINPVQEAQNPIADAVPSIRSHYIVNVSQGNQEAGIRYLIQNQNCNLNETIPESFWQGNYSIQQCYIFLSPEGFNSVLIPHSSLETPIVLETTYIDEK